MWDDEDSGSSKTERKRREGSAANCFSLKELLRGRVAAAERAATSSDCDSALVEMGAVDPSRFRGTRCVAPTSADLDRAEVAREGDSGERNGVVPPGGEVASSVSRE